MASVTSAINKSKYNNDDDKKQREIFISYPPPLYGR